MSRTGLAVVALLAVLVVPALAAWSPTAKEVDFANVVGDARSAIDDWLNGDASADIDKGTKAILKAADKQLAKAEDRWDSPEWLDVYRALDDLDDALRLLGIARRANRKNDDFTTFVDDTGSDFYTLAKNAAISAADYVNDNFDTKKATKKLLRAGAKTTKAARVVKGDKPRYGKGVRLSAKAIRLLGKAGLLDDVPG